MIISYKHKFIFIKTVKTAGSSFEMALASICGPDDIITKLSVNEEKLKRELGIRGAQNDYIPVSKWDFHYLKRMISSRKLPQFNAHDPAIRIKKYLNESTWESYYKFCFERNPFDKIISWYYYRKSTGHTSDENIDKFILNGGLRTIVNFDQYSIDNLVIVDDIYKIENLDESLKLISDKLNLDKVLEMPSFRAKSTSRTDKRPYNEVLSENAKALIEDAFAREIKLLDYKF